MNLFKIGGILIQSKSDLEEIIKKIDFGKKSIIIFSAFGKTTYNLNQVVKNAIKSNSEYEEAIFDLKQFFQQFSNSAEYRKEISSIFLEFQKKLRSIQILKECPPKTLDSILAFGEKLSGTAFYSVLGQMQIKSKVFDSTQLIKTNSDYNNASLDLEKSTLKILSIKDKLIEGINLFAGFIGSDKNETVTTMGFEGSNITPIAIAIALELKSVTFVSDVNGIYSFDPKLYKQAILLEQISFDTALVASKFGLKLLPIQMIELAKNSNMSLKFKGINSNRSSNISKIGTSDYIIVKKNQQFIICGPSIQFLNKIAQISSVKSINFIKDHQLKVHSDDDILLDLHQILFSK